MLSLFVLSLLIGYICGQDLCDCGVDNIDCADECPFGCTAQSGSEDVCIIETFDMPSTTEGCDDDDDAHNWSVEWIGSSTQFRLYDPCDSKFVKIKMDDLTEYDSDDKKTGNKETSFASSDWDKAGGVYSTYNGANSIVNTFYASELTGMSASFTLQTIFFREDVEVKMDDENVTVSQNNMKFGIKIENWDYETDGNYINLCISIMTNKAGDIDNNPDTTTYYMDGFMFRNEANATCDDNDDIEVTTSPGGNGNNQVDLCYSFPYCASGNITYDPIISYNSAKSAHYIGAMLVISFISMFL